MKNTVTPKQMIQLQKLAVDSGIDRQGLQKVMVQFAELLKNPDKPKWFVNEDPAMLLRATKLREPVMLDVDAQLSFDQTIAAGRYESGAGGAIIESRFPLDSGPSRKVEMHFVPFDEAMTLPQVRAALRRRELQPAPLRDFLTIGIGAPSLQLHWSIMCITSSWNDNGGNINFPYLCNYEGRRGLHLKRTGAADADKARLAAGLHFAAVPMAA